jgi:hypothetical protein
MYEYRLPYVKLCVPWPCEIRCCLFIPPCTPKNARSFTPMLTYARSLCITCRRSYSPLPAAMLTKLADCKEQLVDLLHR